MFFQYFHLNLFNDEKLGQGLDPLGAIPIKGAICNKV
jgi:hypothetical protein